MQGYRNIAANYNFKMHLISPYSVIKECVQRRTIAAITNERGSEGALCNQCDLFAVDVPVRVSWPGYLIVIMRIVRNVSCSYDCDLNLNIYLTI